MFEALFRRNTAMDIDRLIFEVAEHKRPGDYEVFCESIAGRTFFVRVEGASTQGLPHGVGYRIQSTDKLALTGLANIQGLKLLPLYTSSEDKRLHGSYAEIEGLEALRMVMKGDSVDGVLFQNKGQSWLVFKRDQIKQILANDGQ